MSKIFQTDQGTKVSAGAAGQRVSMVIAKGVFTFHETMSPADAADFGRAIVKAAEMASGAPLAVAAGKATR